MAGSKFQYDESGGTFFYFLLSFLALVVIPCTYYLWPREDKKEESKRGDRKCHCDRCAIKLGYLQTREPWKKTQKTIIKVILLIGWVALIACAYKVAHIQHDIITFNPFEILNVEEGATNAEIKKAYRRLSLIHHPDKGGDEYTFMRISKAYAALTDEEAKKNWETYGNPDGPTSMSFGIALPSWIVEKENSIIVLGIYALVFMIALPVAVGIWWYNSVKYGGDQVLLDTTQLYYYFIHKTPHMIFKRVVMVLAASLEFEKGHNGEVTERPTDNYEVPQLMKELPYLNEKNKERPLCYGYSIKARALLHAHLSRLDLPPNSLEIDKNYIIKKCPYLLQEFVQCVSQLTMLALSGRIARTPNLDTLENAMKLCPLIIQAMWDSKSPLMQLPHITDEILRYFTTKKRSIRNVKQLAMMSNEERKSLLRNLTDDQFENVMTVVSKMPLLEMDVKSEVLDDEDAANITAGAIVTVTVSLTRQNMSSLFDKEHYFEGEKADMRDMENEYDAVPTEINNENALPNGDLVNGNAVHELPNIKKPKVWEKTKGKKKGAKAGKAKKKLQQQTLTKNKKQTPGQSNAVVVASTNAAESSPKPKSSKQKPSNNDSDADSEDNDKSDDESHASHNQSASETEGDSGSKKAVKSSVDDNEEEEEWDKFQQKVGKKEKVLETKSKLSHSVHCPYFPEDKQEHWWVYVADRKRHALITVPFLMTNLVDKEETELKFTAPPKPGVYTYSVIVRSDSYVDFDVTKTIKLDVKEAPKEIVSHPQWDISEEEEEVDKEEDSAIEDSDLVASSDEDEDSSDD